MLSSSHRFCIKQKEVILANVMANHLFLFILLALKAYLLVYSGGAKRSRTVDLLRARQALYQLSYGPM